MIIELIISMALFFAVGAALIGLIHTMQASVASQRRNDWIKYGVFLAIVATVIAFAQAGRASFCCLLVTLFIAGAGELWRAVKKTSRLNPLMAGVCMVMIAAGLGHLLLFNERQWFPSCAFIFLLVCMTDSYAQLVGRLVGKRRLCPHISPHKTVAGFVGGMGAALVAALAFRFLQPDMGLGQIIALGLITGAAAVAGDLVFSTIKRHLGIKDFSGILPRHGGILDRFDSLIVAAPAFFWAQFAFRLSNGGIS